MNRIDLLKGNLTTSAMSFYAECMKIYDENTAKIMLSENVKQYLSDEDKIDITIDMLTDIKEKLIEKDGVTKEEYIKMELRSQISSIIDVLFIMKEVTH